MITHLQTLCILNIKKLSVFWSLSFETVVLKMWASKYECIFIPNQNSKFLNAKLLFGSKLQNQEL